MDADIAAARKWYKQYGITFHALVDRNFALNLETIPRVYMVDEHGIVKGTKPDPAFAGGLKEGTTSARRWIQPGARTSASEMRRLRDLCAREPGNLAAVVEFASRCVDAGGADEARRALSSAIEQCRDVTADPLLFHAMLQLIRANEGNPAKQAEIAERAIALRPPFGQAKALRVTYAQGDTKKQ